MSVLTIPSPCIELNHAIIDARRVIRSIDQVTRVDVLQAACGPVLLKREDLSHVRSFKWRGAAYRMHALFAAGVRNVVAASAGNHAQGVASAARRLGMQATILMPSSTPRIKAQQVIRLGSSNIRVILAGEDFAESAALAAAHAHDHGWEVVEAFDHPAVIAGQGTIGCELLEQAPRCDAVFVPVGGGGLIAGVACAIKSQAPHVRVVGVEVAGQDSMTQSLQAGRRVTLSSVSRFCDGTAVNRPGVLPFEVCRTLVDEMLTVTEDEVCAAMQTLWDAERVIPEPSGAIGLAGALQQAERGASAAAYRVPATIITGANMDFAALERVAQRAGIIRAVSA